MPRKTDIFNQGIVYGGLSVLAFPIVMVIAVVTLTMGAVLMDVIIPGSIQWLIPGIEQ